MTYEDGTHEIALQNLQARSSRLRKDNADISSGCPAVGFGTYKNTLLLPRPKHMYPTGKSDWITVDKCVVEEVLHLWNQGIWTLESCCGHTRLRGYIAVKDESRHAMLSLGYVEDTQTGSGVFYCKTICGIDGSGNAGIRQIAEPSDSAHVYPTHGEGLPISHAPSMGVSPANNPASGQLSAAQIASMSSHAAPVDARDGGDIRAVLQSDEVREKVARAMYDDDMGVSGAWDATLPMPLSGPQMVKDYTARSAVAITAIMEALDE